MTQKVYTNLQDMFNDCYVGICKQGKPAIDSTYERNCMFRTVDGRKCAVGILLDDSTHKLIGLDEKNSQGELINPSGHCWQTCILKGQPYYTAQEKASLEILSFIAPNVPYANRLCYDMQNAHDSASDYANFLAEFKHKMKLVAEDYRLTVPEV